MKNQAPSDSESGTGQPFEDSNPSVSVIIPNWNGTRHLPTCLDSLRKQTFRNFETVVVDNASTDGSISLLENEYPEVRIIHLPKNVFFSGAVNEGIRQTNTEIVVLLNNDTEAESRWLEELIKPLLVFGDVGMVASKMLLFDRRNVLNSSGDFYRISGIPGNRGVWEEDRGQYDASLEPFGPCAGAAAYRRSMLEDIGLFDEDFVGYCEDVDLSFRARLRGYRCRFAPKARIYHKLSATGGGPIASFLCGRNFINIVVKNMPGMLIRKHWHRIILAQLSITWEALCHFREPAARARIRGQLAAGLQLKKMLQKRRAIMSTRKTSDEQIEVLLTSR